MDNFDPTNPLHQEQRMLTDMVQKQVAAGRLPMSALGQSKRPEGFSFDQYRALTERNSDAGAFGTSPTTPNAGAWKDLARTRVSQAESHSPMAYDDAAKGAAARTVGYGFNLAQPWVRDGIKAVTGWGDADVKGLAAGTKHLGVPESGKVLDHFLDIFNAEVTNATRGQALSAPQRAALVDLAYNSGTPALKQRGIFDKLQAGDMRGVMAAIASWPAPTNIKTGAPLLHVRERRRMAAQDIAGPEFHKYKDLFQ